MTATKRKKRKTSKSAKTALFGSVIQSKGDEEFINAVLTPARDAVFEKLKSEGIGAEPSDVVWISIQKDASIQAVVMPRHRALEVLSKESIRNMSATPAPPTHVYVLYQWGQEAEQSLFGIAARHGLSLQRGKETGQVLIN